MGLRIKFENAMKDWIEAYGRPTFDEEADIYKETEWQMAWVAFQRAMRLKQEA